VNSAGNSQGTIPKNSLDTVLPCLQCGLVSTYSISCGLQALLNYSGLPLSCLDRAKSKMRKAAIKAGLISTHDPLDRLMITSEPEAGALYCEQRCREADLVEGDRFMICDAGGGTIDLIVL
jgi:hypothetical protein